MMRRSEGYSRPLVYARDVTSLPHASPRLLAGVGSLAIAVVAAWTIEHAPNAPAGRRSWPRSVIERLRTDLERGGRPARVWLLVVAWGALVTGLHFGGLALGIYTRFFWWDVLTHAMGGAGVGGVLLHGLRDRTPPGTAPWWLVSAVAAVGAGFEVYEFVFKDFWYRWSFRFYLVDTAVDIVVNTAGAAVLVLAVVASNRVRATRRRDPDRL
jgi:hypothetical protein